MPATHMLNDEIKHLCLNGDVKTTGRLIRNE